MVMYSDGVTEAENKKDEFFSESRLIDALRANAQQPPAALLETIAKAVQDFSGGEQQDDITILIARCGP